MAEESTYDEVKIRGDVPGSRIPDERRFRSL